MRRKRERLLGITLLLVTILGVGGGLGYAWSQRDDVPRDRDHCPEASRIKASIAVMVDRTDPFTIAQRDAVERIITDLADRMGTDERLALHVITGNAEDAAMPWAPPGAPRGFRYCKSQDPRTVNKVTQTERFVRAEYDRNFGRPLASALAELLKGSAAPESPILESLDALLSSGVAVDRLVIISDLLQHINGGHSHLTGRLPDPCAIAASPLGQRLKARDWSRMTVTLHVLRNSKHRDRQGPEHIGWWARLFYELGAAAVLEGERVVPRAANVCAIPTEKPAKKRKNKSS